MYRTIPADFVSIEEMTSYESGNLSINYSIVESPFGKVFIASTHKGVCIMEFSDVEEESCRRLQSGFPNAVIIEKSDAFQLAALSVFDKDMYGQKEIRLHLKGTDFQLKVWDALLHIPFGKTVSYADIASYIGNSKACRAVGSAIGDNPVALIIPCHRVIRSDGKTGNYRWGTDLKIAIIRWESSFCFKF